MWPYNLRQLYPAYQHNSNIVLSSHEFFLFLFLAEKKRNTSFSNTLDIVHCGFLFWNLAQIKLIN